jgi:hypothetical protein
VTAHRRLILKKAEHLQRMADYLSWSLGRVQRFVPIASWDSLTAEQHESLAAFRVRSSEFQAHIGKAMPAIAIEEEENVEPFGAVLAFMEKLGILDSTRHWKLIRELRNAVNHEYEDDPQRLVEFFDQLTQETPALPGYGEALLTFVDKHYRDE